MGNVIEESKSLINRIREIQAPAVGVEDEDS